MYRAIELPPDITYIWSLPLLAPLTHLSLTENAGKTSSPSTLHILPGLVCFYCWHSLTTSVQCFLHSPPVVTDLLTWGQGYNRICITDQIQNCECLKQQINQIKSFNHPALHIQHVLDSITPHDVLFCYGNYPVPANWRNSMSYGWYGHMRCNIQPGLCLCHLTP